MTSCVTLLALPLTTTAIRGSCGKTLPPAELPETEPEAALAGLELRPTWLGRLGGSGSGRLGGLESGFCIAANAHTKLEGKA
jgi:hypothetical protein